MSYLAKADLVTTGHDLTAVGDPTIVLICSQAESMVDSFLQQPLSAVESVEFQQAVMADGYFIMFVDELPIVAVKQVVFTRSDDSEVTLTSGLLRIDNGRGCILMKVGTVGGIDRTVPVEVTYTHGFTAIPPAAKAGALIVAKQLLDEYVATKLTGLGGSGNVSDNGRSVSRQATVWEVPESAQALLAPYKRVR